MVQRVTLIMFEAEITRNTRSITRRSVSNYRSFSSASIEPIVGLCAQSGSDIRGDERKTLGDERMDIRSRVRELRLTCSFAEMTPALSTRGSMWLSGGTRYRIIPD